MTGFFLHVHRAGCVQYIRTQYASTVYAVSAATSLMAADKSIRGVVVRHGGKNVCVIPREDAEIEIR
jgi:hypothetical protein